MVGQLVGGEIGRFQEALVEASYPRTTTHFVDLLKAGHPMPRLVHHALEAAAPYLTVPSHVMVSDTGELK